MRLLRLTKALVLGLLVAACSRSQPPPAPVAEAAPQLYALQGEAMLELGRPRDAEQAFRDDLRKFPANAWSEAGLKRSLQR